MAMVVHQEMIVISIVMVQIGLALPIDACRSICWKTGI